MGVLPLLAYLLLLTGAQALYPSGPRLDQELPRGDEVSQEVELAVPIKFYGQTLQSIYVNGNGLLSFLTEIPRFFNEPFPLEYPVVAPFYSNVDTSSTGTVYYRESREQEVLSTIASKVANLYPSIPDFRPLAAFIATWDRVGYFEGKSDKVNTYQAVIASDGSESFVELLYPNNGITWIRAESGKSSRPDARGQAGLSSPGGKLAVLKGSGTDRVYNLPRWTNTLTPGEYMFRVGNIEETGIPEPPQRAIQNEEEEHDEPQTCSDGAHLCHKSSDCFDQPEGGFCCRCQKRYFGDGKNCLDYEAHRMIGRVNISLNGVESQNLNMQAFIVTGDGRTYTAISGVPQYIGYNMQLLVSLGSFVGFLFAKPIGDAPNGYQLTGGVVNHTVDISFGSQHHVTINQRYTGLDLFEQVKMEAEVTGTIPPVAPGAKLGVLDFQEQFTRIGPGLFRSQSRHNVEYLDNSKETYDINVDQTIQFTEYCPSAYKGLSSLRLKSSRNFLKYEPKDMILRLASTNKVSQNADGHDPCTEGHVTCVANSTCLVEEDSFRCVCNTGFQTLPEQTSDFGCVDINECEDGSGNCDSKALCVNEVGTYSCQCFPGYIGDGRHCEALEQPKTPTLSNGVCRGYGDHLSCNCDDGFEKIPDTSEIGFKCEDIDECYVSISCDQNAECINSFGSFNCRCLPGYVGDGFSCNEDEGSCQNMDCPDGTLCRETRDGPECVCSPGYVGTVPHCRPQDACQTDSDCRENNVCMWNSTLGYSACTCREGYIQDEKSCLPPANEHALVRTCMRGECRCPHGYEDNGQFCVPSTTAAPSTYRQTSCKNQENCHENAKCIYVHDKKDYECKCNPGFEGDGYSCTEFEMSCNQNSICDINAGCHYDSSSERYICICNEGYQGDGTTCFPIIEEQCPTCHLYGICISGSCSCIEGYVGDGIVYCEKEVPDCDTLGNCDPNADCLYDTMEQGHRCKCRTGYEGDGYTCNELITCHEHTEICSQDATCTISYETYTYSCQCNEGFFGNGSHCKEINRQEEEFLLLNKGMATIQLPFQPAGNNIGRPIQINGNQRAIGIAVDCIEGRVYWSDILNQKIKSSKYDGGDVQDFIVSGVKSPEGLAIDWINRVLYWTDSGLHVIASAKLDDRKIVNIISNGLVNPRGIAVHPYLRKIFWSDWYRKNPVIEIADLDGRNREVLVQNPNVKLANSLAIDWDSNETCWADAGLKTIECIDFYQRIQRSVVQNCTYPFGLAITPDAYYWTDWYTGKVESSKKGSGKLTKSIPLPIGGDDKLYGLAAVTSFCPR